MDTIQQISVRRGNIRNAHFYRDRMQQRYSQRMTEQSEWVRCRLAEWPRKQRGADIFTEQLDESTRREVARI